MNRLLALALVALVPLAFPVLAPAQEYRVQLGTAVRPETVTVGDPFVAVLRVRVPAGATVDFPPPPDTSGPVQALDPVSIRDTVLGAESEYTATYRLAAWDVGTLPVPLGELLVRQQGVERRVSLAALQVQVRSVLPADSTKHVPKPARPPVEVPVSQWWKWLLALLAAALLGALAWWWHRRRNRPRPVPVPDPLAAAEQEFSRVEALGLLEAGERGRYVALMVDVVRDYLARRAGTPVSLTSAELVAALRRNGRVPLDRLAPLLTEADLVKFARYQVGPDRAAHLGDEARAVVQAAHAATEPAPQQPPGPSRERAA